MKIYLLLFIVFLIFENIFSQNPERKQQTVAADVLALMPASNSEVFNKLMEELLVAGEEAILIICRQLYTLENENKVKAEFCLSGLSTYVSGISNENLRLRVNNAYLKSLDESEKAAAKNFIINLLSFTAGDECVEKLAELLKDETFSEHAAITLSIINSEKSKEALINTLKINPYGKIKRDIISAIGYAEFANVEPVVLSFYNYISDLNIVILNTLSKIGTKSSLKLLSSEAEKAILANGNTEVVAYYIHLLKRIISQGERNLAKKEAEKLLQIATKSNKIQFRIAALEIVMMIDKTPNIVLKSLKDQNPEYRTSALNFSSKFADEKLYLELLKYLNKSEKTVKIEILRWFDKECENSSKKELIAKLLINKKQTATDLIVLQLETKDFCVKESAASILAKIGNAKALNAWVKLLANEDVEDIKIGKKYLSVFDGSINNEVARIISKANDNGKIAGIELLAMRGATLKKDVVFDLLVNGSPKVKEAAFNCLKGVVAITDFQNLCTMLENSETETVIPLQQAIIASIESISENEKMRRVKARYERAEKPKKHLYYHILSEIKQKDALDILVSAYKNERGAVKEAAFEAIINWAGIEAAFELYEICKDKSAITYFDKAFENYVNKISNSNLTDENKVIYLRESLSIAKENHQIETVVRELGKTNTFQAFLICTKFLDSAIKTTAADAIINIVLNNKSLTGTIVRKSLNSSMQIIENQDAVYLIDAVRKILDEMPEEGGFISIFNGKDLTGWKGLVQNPIKRATMMPSILSKEQEKATNLMLQNWKVENEELFYNGKGFDNICTDKQYGDFEMYIDWKLDPHGREPDSGIYLRGTPQVQIWDTSQKNIGAQVGSGGLFNNINNEKNPLMVADNRLGDWNTFYIKMVWDRVTVKLNGHLVVDNVILENFWDRSQPLFLMEQIELQAHENKVYFRDIYIKELERSEPFKLSRDEQNEGFVILFDGTNMHNWTGNTSDYLMEDYNIVLYPNRGSGGNLYTKKEYSDFIFRFEFQLTPAANNGLGIRTPMVGDAAYVGMELQILDDEHPVYKDLFDYQYHGSVYGVIPAKRGFLKPVGEWNYQEVIAKGNNIKITLNGTVILDGDIQEASKNGTIDGYDHPGLLNKKGHIGFLGHGSQVKFRNIRIKEL